MIFAVIFMGFISGLLVNCLSDVPYPSVEKVNYFNVYKINSLPRERKNRTYLVFAFCVLLTLIFYLFIPSILLATATYLFCIYLLWVSVVDFEHREVLISAMISGIVIWGIIGVYFQGIQSTLLGGLSAFGAQLFVYFLGLGYKHFFVRKNNDEDNVDPLGFGDVVMSGILGMALGWPNSIEAFFVSGLIGSIYAWIVIAYIKLIKEGDTKNMSVPYIIFLSLGALLVYVNI
jgi:prepilin signal peptidase PulO-like enzyme (type II secretory pathway)